MAVEIMGFCVNIGAKRVCEPLHLTHPTGRDAPSASSALVGLDGADNFALNKICFTKPKYKNSYVYFNLLMYFQIQYNILMQLSKYQSVISEVIKTVNFKEFKCLFY